MKHPIGKRLLSAAEFVRQGAYFADIGTDHAYLPLFLLEEEKIERAVCADINAGPLESAKNSDGLVLNPQGKTPRNTACLTG